MATEGEAAGRRIFGFSWTDGAGVMFGVGSGAKAALRKNRQNGDGAAEIVGDEQIFSRRVKADVGRTGTAGWDGVEQRGFSGGAGDGECADAALFALADTVGFVGGIEARTGSVQGQATWAGSEFIDIV